MRTAFWSESKEIEGVNLCWFRFHWYWLILRAWNYAARAILNWNICFPRDYVFISDLYCDYPKWLLRLKIILCYQNPFNLQLGDASCELDIISDELNLKYRCLCTLDFLHYCWSFDVHSVPLSVPFEHVQGITPCTVSLNHILDLICQAWVNRTVASISLALERPVGRSNAIALPASEWDLFSLNYQDLWSVFVCSVSGDCWVCGWKWRREKKLVFKERRVSGRQKVLQIKIKKRDILLWLRGKGCLRWREKIERGSRCKKSQWLYWLLNSVYKVKGLKLLFKLNS